MLKTDTLKINFDLLMCFDFNGLLIDYIIIDPSLPPATPLPFSHSVRVWLGLLQVPPMSPQASPPPPSLLPGLPCLPRSPGLPAVSPGNRPASSNVSPGHLPGLPPCLPEQLSPVLAGVSRVTAGGSAGVFSPSNCQGSSHAFCS